MTVSCTASLGQALDDRDDLLIGASYDMEIKISFGIDYNNETNHKFMFQTNSLLQLLVPTIQEDGKVGIGTFTSTETTRRRRI